MPEVNVLIPLYGHRRGCTLPAVLQAWLGQTLDTEIIIATDGVLPADVAGAVSVSRAVRVVRTDAAVGAPGVLRNLAAGHAQARVLYLSDADVLPLGADFLTRALALANGQVIGQPWMYRLTGSTHVSQPPHNQSSLRFQSPGPGRYCYVYAGTDGSLHPSGGERFRWRQSTGTGTSTEILAVFPPPAHRAPGLSARLQWVAPFHWGGLLLTRQIFEEVGGYCRRYQGWGFEDDDLLVKVESRCRVVRAWKIDPTLSCLHFEHPRVRLDAEDPKANALRYTDRVAAGAATMIAEDLVAAQEGRAGQ
jgi:hypothetical protein